jgi:hypothetical protein
LFDPRGVVSRSVFALATVILIGLKVAGDFALAQLIFHRSWTLRQYLFPRVEFLFHGTPPWAFDAVLLLWAAPFTWIGLSLLAKRIRSAGAAMPLVILFFIPVAKFFLFAVLCALPERKQFEEQEVLTPRVRRWLPESPLGSAGVAVVCSTAVGVASALLATERTRTYLVWLFLGLPFLMGYLAASIHGLGRPRKLRESFATAYLSLAITAAVLLSIAAEGIICIIMAAPIALCEATVGAWIAHSLRQTSWRNRAGGPSAIAACLTLPVLAMLESTTQVRPTEFAVTSQLSIDAPPEIVWRHVISFAEIPPPHEWIFRFGVAYPEQARIDGHGVGALRHCVFSTGEFLEPITVWDEPNELAFDVIAQPDPLTELSPYRHLRPPHLNGYFQSHRGEFRLTRTAHGTLLAGTTWYSNRLEPQIYWKLSDALIHRIHIRVLEQIKREAEISATVDSSRLGDDSPAQR